MKYNTKKENRKIRDIYSYCFNEIRNLRYYIIVVLGFFFLSAIFGYIFHDMLSEIFLEKIAEILERIKDLNFYQLFFFIFRNNSLISFVSLILGFLFGVIPAFVTISNGLMLGFVSRIAISEQGIGSLWMLLPHGIFELPAVFISLALGLQIGLRFVFNIGEKEQDRYSILKSNLWRGLKIFVFVVLPLLLIAAFVETILIFYL